MTPNLWVLWWNPENEEWYAPNKSAKYTALIKKYS